MLTVLVWTIWATNIYVHDGGKKTVGESEAVEKSNFPTRDQCVAEIDKQLDWMEKQGVAKRVSKYEIRSNTPVPYLEDWTTRWECKESK